MWPKLGVKAPTVVDLLNATAKTYDWKVIVGEDLMSFKIEESGITVIEPPRK